MLSKGQTKPLLPTVSVEPSVLEADIEPDLCLTVPAVERLSLSDGVPSPRDGGGDQRMRGGGDKQKQNHEVCMQQFVCNAVPRSGPRPVYFISLIHFTRCRQYQSQALVAAGEPLWTQKSLSYYY